MSWSSVGTHAISSAKPSNEICQETRRTKQTHKRKQSTKNFKMRAHKTSIHKQQQDSCPSHSPMVVNRLTLTTHNHTRLTPTLTHLRLSISLEWARGKGGSYFFQTFLSVKYTADGMNVHRSTCGKFSSAGNAPYTVWYNFCHLIQSQEQHSSDPHAQNRKRCSE